MTYSPPFVISNVVFVYISLCLEREGHNIIIISCELGTLYYVYYKGTTTYGLALNSWPHPSVFVGALAVPLMPINILEEMDGR